MDLINGRAVTSSLWLRLHNFDIKIEKLKVQTFTGVTDFLLILSSWIQLSHIIRYLKVSNTEEYLSSFQELLKCVVTETFDDK